MTDSPLIRRQRKEFVAFTLQVMCEREDCDRIMDGVSQAAANTDGSIQAEVIHGPHALTDSDWSEVNETVNLLVDMREGFGKSA